MFGILSKDAHMISDMKFVFLPTFYYYELYIHLFSGSELLLIHYFIWMFYFLTQDTLYHEICFFLHLLLC